MKKVKLSLFAIAVFASANGLACSCKSRDAEEVVHTHELGLSKIQIIDVSLSEKARLLFNNKKEYTRTYKIKVLENYKGSLDATFITINGMGDGDCGLDVSYGQTLFVITPIKGLIIPNKVSVCNTVSESFAAKVKEELKKSNAAFKSVDTTEWVLLEKTRNKSLYADFKSVTKDEFGSYIWLLSNDTSADFKSKKTKIQIACKEKMYSLSHEIEFSDFNANGLVLMTSNYQAQNTYAWKPLNHAYSKLLKYTC